MGSAAARGVLVVGDLPCGGGPSGESGRGTPIAGDRATFRDAPRRAWRGRRWAVDTWAAVGAEVAAALRISLGRAGSLMKYALAIQRLPRVAAAFEAGDLTMDTFRTIFYRTELITDEAVMAEVDRRLAARVPRWTSMTYGRLIAEIDREIVTMDPDAVRRARDAKRDRDITVWHGTDGIAEISGRLLGTDAQVLDQRLDALAATVCPADPRTVAERRADAMGALAAGAERLMCRCGGPECPATAATASPIVIHVVADRSTLDGGAENPGYLMGADALIPPELLRELAASARLRPLIQPADGVAEPGYRPSRALADFVRARDLTCRAPGCDRPATFCDLDHTTPWAVGGATHASNIKCLCRFHHLIKTFWGWKDHQLQDGTVIWTLPDGTTHVTLPGSALLFPALMVPTGEVPNTPQSPRRGERTAMMPARKTTRAQNRSHRIATERSHNHRLREAALAAQLGGPIKWEQLSHPGDDPPF